MNSAIVASIVAGNIFLLLLLFFGLFRMAAAINRTGGDLPGTSYGRIFVCGDIHGCIDPLLASLADVGFDRERDHLYALGNLVDWGPASTAVLNLLDEPWFSSTLGHHETLLLEAVTGDYRRHARNGGVWFAWRSQEERAAFAAKVQALPVAITVTTPSGRRVGLVHAEVIGDDWSYFFNRVNQPAVRASALMMGERAKSATRGGVFEPIRNIDHVYFGHTPVREPVRVANMSWINTGCVATGNLTIEELV